MIYYLTALINGFFNSVNRMTNVRAGKLFGTANGALINYVEATVLSLLLMLVLKNGNELSFCNFAEHVEPCWQKSRHVSKTEHSACCAPQSFCFWSAWSGLKKKKPEGQDSSAEGE